MLSASGGFVPDPLTRGSAPEPRSAGGSAADTVIGSRSAVAMSAHFKPLARKFTPMDTTACRLIYQLSYMHVNYNEENLSFNLWKQLYTCERFLTNVQLKEKADSRLIANVADDEFVVGCSILHIVFTLIVQLVIMRRLEKMLGWLRIIIIYTVCGMAANVFSGIFLPYFVTVRINSSSTSFARRTASNRRLHFKGNGKGKGRILL